METIIIALAALLASGLTLFSGFGLGTLLMPVIAMFVSPELAIGITAIVHFSNNLFKLGLLGLHADKNVIVRFGIPAIFAAFCGAFLLNWLTSLPILFEYALFDSTKTVTPIKLVVGLLIIAFVSVELFPVFSSMTIDKKFLPVGGIISGFFGGLSGNQGAFRSMFLIKAGLSKEQFIATGVVLAVMVDLSRMTIYGWDAAITQKTIDWEIVIVATISAFIGSFFGSRLIKKVTIHSIQLMVSGLLIFVALGLITGIF